jgi:chaperonin GroES
MLTSYKNKILAKRVGEDTITSNGVIKTSNGKEKPLVISVIESGVDGISKGDSFLIARYSGVEFDYNGEEYIVVVEDDIIATIKKGDKK